MTARLGVDIGGTFTDLVVIDETTGAARVGKVLTTPKDPAHAVEQGIASLLDESRISAGAVRAVVHGTRSRPMPSSSARARGPRS